jgi:hypothetical protein
VVRVTGPTTLPATRCPSCFVALAPDRWAWRCTNGECRDVPDVQASAHSGSEVRRRPVVDVTSAPGVVPQVSCPECHRPAQQESCPRCHYDLPNGWRHCTTTCVAMAGARWSGKSIYIAVLIRQAELLAADLGGALGFGDDRTQQIYTRVYQQPLYEQRGLMPSTTSSKIANAYQREPLMFRFGTLGGRTHVLVVRDVAGEDLQERSDPAQFSFFRDADTVVFMFDPMRVEQIRAQLRGIMSEPPGNGADPLLVLNNLTRLMLGGADLAARKVTTPLAVVVAKFDTLHELTRISGTDWAAVMDNPGAAFNRDPTPTSRPVFDTVDADLLQEEVRSLLVKLNAQPLLNQLGTVFVNYRLFAVSALGAPPVNAEVVSRRGISPFRCLDPLKWALHNSGVLAAT